MSQLTGLVNVMFCSRHCLYAHLLHFSHFLYPNKSWRGGDSGEDDASSSGDGKYELLSIANKLIAEEIRNVMSKSKHKAVFVWVKLTYNIYCRFKWIGFLYILKVFCNTAIFSCE